MTYQNVLNTEPGVGQSSDLSIGDYLTNALYEIYGDAVSGHLRIMTERDRATLKLASEVLSRFSKVIPTGKALSGDTTEADIKMAEPIARELRTLRIYETPTNEEVESFILAMNSLNINDLKNYPVVMYLTGENGQKMRSTTTVQAFLSKCSRKNEFILVLADIYRRQTPKMVGMQLRIVRGRLKAARRTAGLPMEGSGKNA